MSVVRKKTVAKAKAAGLPAVRRTVTKRYSGRVYAGMPHPDTKDPKGVYTFDDVVDILATLRGLAYDPKVGSALGFTILEIVGEVPSVRVLRPKDYDRVVKLCDAIVAAQRAEARVIRFLCDHWE